MRLMAEVEEVARGWRMLTIDHLTIDSPEGAALYEQVMDLFAEMATGRECRQHATSSSLTLGICGPNAEERIDRLRTRLDDLNPPSFWGGHQWEIRDGAR